MTNLRIDVALVKRGLCLSRSSASNALALGHIKLNGNVVTKSAIPVKPTDTLELTRPDLYVSRAGYKLESVSQRLGVDYLNKTVLDIGSSTGGFTQFALLSGAKQVIAVDVGSRQLHPSLHGNPKIQLYEQTDIRNFGANYIGEKVDLVLADVSFISLKLILPTLDNLITPETELIVMCKPQFETVAKNLHDGVVKNNSIRRQILADFEHWLRDHNFAILAKADSSVSGQKGNVERFYKLRITK